MSRTRGVSGGVQPPPIPQAQPAQQQPQGPRLVTETQLNGLFARVLDQIAGGVAANWGRALGQTGPVQALIRKVGTGLFSTIIGTVGIAGLGAVLSDATKVGAILTPLGVPEGLVKLIAENIGDAAEGLNAERLRQMSLPEAERLTADYVTKEVAKISAKLSTSNFLEAYAFMSRDEKLQLDGYIRDMSVAQREEWERVYRPQLISYKFLRDALDINGDSASFVGYLGRMFPAKAPSAAQAKAFSLMDRGMNLVTKVADPKKALTDVAASIDAGTAEIERKNAERKARIAALRTRR